MTRRLSTLVAVCALALCAFGGTASAAQPASPGCAGEVTSGTAQAVGGLGHIAELGLVYVDAEANVVIITRPDEFRKHFVGGFCAEEPV
jgi:hypothetical protein